MAQYASTTVPLEQRIIDRQRRTAEMLMQQGAEPLPAGQMVGNRFVPTPWTQGLAKALQAFGGFYLDKKANDSERAATDDRVRRENDAFRATHGLLLPSEMNGGSSVVEERGAPTRPYGEVFKGVSSDPTSLTPNLRAPQVDVSGKAPDPRNQLLADILSGAEGSGVSVFDVLGRDPVLQQRLAALNKEDVPTVVGEGGAVIKGGKEIYRNNKRVEPRKPTLVTTGAGVDAQGRPRETQVILNEDGTTTPIRGIEPVIKGPLATANASVSTKDPFKAERDLRNDFKSEPIYKAHMEVRSAYDQIRSALKQSTPISDVAAATKIMKLLDPGSVVRESELGIAMSSTGLLDRVTNYANTIIKGQRITPQQRKEFQALADEFFKMSEQQYDAKAKEYKGIASDYGLNADRVGGRSQSGSGDLSQKEKVELEELRQRFRK